MPWLLPIILFTGPASTSQPETRADAETSESSAGDAAEEVVEEPAGGETSPSGGGEPEPDAAGEPSDEVAPAPEAAAPAPASPEPAAAPVRMPAAEPTAVDGQRRLSSFGIAALATAGWGAIGAGLGAWLYVREDSLARDDHSRLVTTKPAGIPVMIAGGAIAVFGVAAFAGEAIMVKRRKTRITAAPLPGGAVLGLAGRF